jgi:tricorn protease
LVYVASTTIVPNWSEMNDLVALDNVATVYMVPLTADAASPFLLKKVEEADGTGAVATPPVAIEPKPAEVKTAYILEGAGEKAFRPPVPAGRYIQADWVQGRLLLLSKAAPIMTRGALTGSAFSFDFATKALTPIGPADSLVISADRTTALISTGSKAQILPVAGGAGVVKPIDLSRAVVTVNPKDEWKQIFEESWRIARDFFYDEGMHGMDWNALRLEYRSKLAQVGSRDDLTHLIEQLISELQCGHCYVGGLPTPGVNEVPMGYLGAEFESAPAGVRISKLFAGDNFGGSPASPLLQPGQKVNAGDYILSVSGQPVVSNQDIQSLLIGTVGQVIQLTVNDKPSLENARTVYVKPHAISAEGGLRYMDWVNSRVEYVKKSAGKDFGYVHVPDMTEAGYTAFVKAQRVNSNRDATIYDFRSNGGGNMSSRILSTIGTKPAFYFHPRGSKINWSRESQAPHGPVAALCDQDAFSDGEFVIETWKRMGLGPVVGKRTGGGEVGSGGGYALIDGQKLSIPNYGAFDPVTNKWIVEGTGATPDYDVDQDPTSIMAGKDPQLDKAIELLKAQLVKTPRKKVVTPPSKNLNKKDGKDSGKS